MNQLISFITANPVASLIGSAIAGVFFWKILSAIYVAIMPIKQAAFFFAAPVFNLASKCGAREEKISDPILKSQIKADSKAAGDFLDKIWDAGIDGQGMPDKQATWDSVTKKGA